MCYSFVVKWVPSCLYLIYRLIYFFVVVVVVVVISIFISHFPFWNFSQTVEAMKTILDSLTMDDYFSIIDFNHNVRCWSEDLVPGTSMQVEEAKKYIQDIKPNGGERVRIKAGGHLLIITGSSFRLIFWESGEMSKGQKEGQVVPSRHIYQRTHLCLLKHHCDVLIDVGLWIWGDLSVMSKATQLRMQTVRGKRTDFFLLLKHNFIIKQ